METKILSSEEENLKLAKSILKKGGLVAFPTETVYGLGADATNSKAVKSIFDAKGRPQDNPLIVHLSDTSKIKKYVKSISSIEQRIIDAFMTGPISIVLQKNNKISNVVTAGLDTVAIRVPSNLEANRFLKAVDLPIAAPSANISGRPSGTCLEDILEEFKTSASGFKTILELFSHVDEVGKKIEESKRSKKFIKNTTIRVNALIVIFFSLRYFPVPEIVPPVPIPEINMSTFPSVSSHISGPVVS